MSGTVRDVGDVIAGTAVVATWASWLPEFAAGLAVIWTLIRIYEWARVRIFGKSGPPV